MIILSRLSHHGGNMRDRQKQIENGLRARARRLGQDVPKLTPGAPKGYKQSREHISRRIKNFGEKNSKWSGDNASIPAGNGRARRWYKKIGNCEICGVSKTERHHIDGNSVNNSPENVMILCRKCHQLKDGRYLKFKLSRNHSKSSDVFLA